MCCPVVVCDHCGEVIKDAKEGNYEFHAGGGPVFFTHKRCCRAFEEAYGGRRMWWWCSLECLPIYLGNNLKLDWEKAKQWAAFFASI
jgi:hypothetical protein